MFFEHGGIDDPSECAERTMSKTPNQDFVVEDSVASGVRRSGRIIDRDDHRLPHL